MTVHNHDLDPSCPEHRAPDGSLRGGCMGEENAESPEKNVTKSSTEPTGEATSDPHEELLTCLEILGEYVDATPTDDADLYNSEFLTACWQTVELVQVLLHEHQTTVRLMNDLIEATQRSVEEQKVNRKQIIVANPEMKGYEPPEWRAARGK